VQALVRALKDEAREVKIKASDSLQKLVPDSKAAIPALTMLLKDPDTTVRLHAAGCLGGFGADAKMAWADLERLHKKEKDPYVLDQIDKAMYSIDSGAAGKAGVLQPGRWGPVAGRPPSEARIG